ncbi:MAG: protease inhibitor I42 family protein [Sphingomicrobium sp.]
MIRTIFLTGAMALAGAASAQAGSDLRPPVVVGEDSGPVRVELGQLLEVRLPMQAGTGYSWAASSDTGNLEFIDQTTLHPWGGAPTVGGSQTQMFIYRAIGPGEAVLRFAYRRPWEGGVPPAKTVEQRVTIEP